LPAGISSTFRSIVARVFASRLSTAIAASVATALLAGTVGAAIATIAVFLPVYRTGRMRGRHLLVGVAFYILYLGLVAVAAGS